MKTEWRNQIPETEDEIPVTSDELPETSDELPATSDDLQETVDDLPETIDKLSAAEVKSFRKHSGAVTSQPKLLREKKGKGENGEKADRNQWKRCFRGIFPYLVAFLLLAAVALSVLAVSWARVESYCSTIEQENEEYFSYE